MQERDRVLLQIKHVSKKFGKLQVLQDFNLTILRGNRLIIIGPSGEGKSTLLRCIMGLENINEGSIWLDGKVYIETIGRKHQVKTRVNRHLRHQIGMVFQSFNLFPHLSILENLILAPTKVYGIKREKAIVKACSLLERMGLQSKIKEYSSRLSGGQQQRVAIARALMLDPQLMLFDEITSALDPELIQEVLDVLKDLANQGMTMIIVTHELDFAKQVGDRIIFISEKKIIEEGKPGDILTNPHEERTKKFLRHLLKED